MIARRMRLCSLVASGVGSIASAYYHPPMRTAPTIETARLILRAHTFADFDASAAMWADPEVTRHIGGTPSTREEVWSRLARYVGQWSLASFGYWCICERANGQFVGECGFSFFVRSLAPPLAHLGVVEGVPEAGWALATHAQGKGYAREAVRAALAWSDAHLTHHARTFCMIDAGHDRSARMARELGFAPIADTTYHGAATQLFARPRADAEPARRGP
jgi:RimJ/RimL family protein N-acetyltransferase